MSVCVKCKTEPPCIDIKFALYCSSCFQEATYHKYRTLLARSRESSPSADKNSNSKGLILLPRNFLSSPSVHLATRVLIHFSQLPGIQEPLRKNLISYDLAVPFEELKTENETGNENENYEIKNFIKHLKEEYPNLGKIYALSLFKESIEEIKEFEQINNFNQFSELDTSNISSTLREDVMNAKLLHLQLKLMNQSGIDRAISTETSTALAAYILSCTCKGRGKFLPWDSALTRSFPQNLFIIRPLKEISDREVELYFQETNLKSDYRNNNNINETVKTNTSALSIDQLTVNFLKNLETENPGTANVVIRTSSKVTTTTIDSSNSSRCSICLAPNDGLFCTSCEVIKSFFS